MAEVQQQQPGKGRTRRHSGRRPYAAIRVDMTPMVDLAFLLLTFFVLTSELSRQNAITARFPKDGPPGMKVQGMTIFLGKDPQKICWFRGEIDPAVHLNVTGTAKNGLLNVLRNANEPVFSQVEVLDRQHNLGLLNDDAWKKRRDDAMNSSSAPFVIVKWDETASYQSVVSVIDGLNRAHNKNYAVVPMTDADKALVAQQE